MMDAARVDTDAATYESLPAAALAGFDAAALRILRHRQPDLRWRTLRDDLDALSERRSSTLHDHTFERAA